MIEGVVAGQELARLGEEHHHHAHHHPHGSAIDVGGVHVAAVLLQRFAVALHEDLHRLAHPLAQHLGELGLALPAVKDGLKQWRGCVLPPGCPDRRLHQRAQCRDLR